MAVFNHVGLSGVTEAEVAERTRATYAGEFLVGADLMTFEIGETVTLVQ